MKSKLKISLAFTIVSFLASCGGGGGDNNTPSSPTSETYRTDVAGKVNTQTTTRALEESVKANVKLIVDSNKDGLFDENSDDKVYETVVTNGKFQFLNVEVPKNGTKANLVISADGYVPYSKVLNLAPNTPVSLDLQLIPASTKVVTVPKARRAGEKLFLTLTKEGEIKVSTGSRAPLSIEDTKLTVSFDTEDLPPDLTTIKATMKTFNSAKREDLKYFPGEFKGKDPEGKGEVGLESLTFSLIDLKDQDGNPLILSPNKADENSCLYSVLQTLPQEAISKIKKKGDFDEKTPGCQVPIYSYNYNSESWDYLGTGTVKDSSGKEVECNALTEGEDYQVDICITKPNWGNYVNLDYPVYYDQVKVAKLCFRLNGSNGEPIPGTWFELSGEGIFFDSYTNDKGVAVIELPVSTSNDTLSCEDVKNYLSDKNINLSYYNPLLSQFAVPVDLNNLQDGSNGCTCELNVKTNISFATVSVKAVKSDNPLPNKEVCLRDDTYFYYECKKTGQDGTAEFKVIGGKTYTAFGSKLETKGGISPSPGGNISVTLKEENNPPEVSVYAYPLLVKKGNSVTVDVYAYDVDEDTLKLESVTCGSSKGEVIYEESYYGYMIASVKCSFDSEGEFTIAAKVSDGESSSQGSVNVNVVSDNAPPIVYGYAFFDNDGDYVPPYMLRINESYTLVLYAYDPDGDSLTYSVDAQNCTEDGDTISCTFTQEGQFSFNVTVSDGKGASIQETIKGEVIGNTPPEIVYAAAQEPQVQPGENLSVLVYAYDPDSETLQASLSVNGESLATGSCSSIDFEGYFECELPVSVPEDVEPGDYELSLTVSDGSDSATQTIPVIVGVPNQPPQITKPLPSEIKLNLGDSYTFEVEAKDPEGENLSYVWFVNGKEVEKDNSTFTYTFGSAGIYEVKVEVSDGENSVYSKTTVTVINPAETKRLVLHFGLEGVYVSLLDENLKVIKTLVSDESGTVDFGDVGADKVNLAITVSPDIVMPEEKVFENFVFHLYELCWNGDSCDIYSEDIGKWIREGKVPLSVADQLLSEDVKSFDKDQDGYLSPDEVYSFLLTLKDENKDGKIEGREVMDRYDVSTTIIKDVPVKEHVINNVAEIFGYSFEEVGYSFGYDWGYGVKEVNVKVTDIPEGVDQLYVGYQVCYVSSIDQTASCTVYVPLLEDGTYSLIMESYGSENKVLVVKDATSDSLTVSYKQFVQKKKVNFINADENAEWEDLSIKTYYKGGEFHAGGFHSGFDEDGVIELNFGTDYFIHYETGTYSAGSHVCRIDDLKFGNTIPDTIDLSKIRANCLKVNLNLDVSNHRITLEGEELSAVDEVDFQQEYLSDEGDFSLELDMPYAGETSVALPEITEILPETVYNNYVKNIVENAYGMWIDAEATDLENFVWDSVDVDEGEERTSEVSIYVNLMKGLKKEKQTIRKKDFKLWH